MIAMVILPIMIERIKEGQEKNPKCIELKVRFNGGRHATSMLRDTGF
jgi:hypothetical protein